MSGGERIPAPTADSGLSIAEIDAWRRNQAILDADPRTNDGQCRPTWLVDRVLAEHGAQRCLAKKEAISTRMRARAGVRR